MSDSRWKRWIGYLIPAMFIFGTGCTMCGVTIGRGHDAFVAGASLTMGLVFLWAGVFETEFVSDDGRNTPISRDLVAQVLIAFSLPLISLGLYCSARLLILALWPEV